MYIYKYLLQNNEEMIYDLDSLLFECASCCLESNAVLPTQFYWSAWNPQNI